MTYKIQWWQQALSIHYSFNIFFNWIIILQGDPIKIATYILNNKTFNNHAITLICWICEEDSMHKRLAYCIFQDALHSLRKNAFHKNLLSKSVNTLDYNPSPHQSHLKFLLSIRSNGSHLYWRFRPIFTGHYIYIYLLEMPVYLKKNLLSNQYKL